MKIDWKITGATTKAKAAEACRLGSLYLETAIRNTVNNGQRSGREYPLVTIGFRYTKKDHSDFELKKKRRMIRSSAPGEPPAKRTGNLINNANLRTEKVSELHYDVILTAEYAKYLEYGTKRMAPRPFIAPNIKKAHAIIDKYLKG